MQSRRSQRLSVESLKEMTNKRLSYNMNDTSQALERKSSNLSVQAVEFIPSSSFFQQQAPSAPVNVRHLSLPRSLSLELEDDKIIAGSPIIVKEENAMEILNNEYESENESLQSYNSESNNGSIDDTSYSSSQSSTPSEEIDSMDSIDFHFLSSPKHSKTKAIAFDPVMNLPIYTNPQSKQTILFLSTTINLPSGYEDCF